MVEVIPTIWLDTCVNDRDLSPEAHTAVSDITANEAKAAGDHYFLSVQRCVVKVAVRQFNISSITFLSWPENTSSVQFS